VPDVHWIDEPGWTPAEGYIHMNADYRLVSDNLLDLSHETFVHKETIGNDAVADHPVALTVTDQGVIRAHREMPNIEPPPFFARLQGAESKVNRLQTACWTAPGINMTDVGFHKVDQPRETALLFRVYHMLTPETDRSTHYFWSLSRNFAPEDGDMTGYIQEATNHTFGEDKGVLELQQQGLDEAPPGTPFPGVAFVIDGAPVRARRILDELIAREQREKRPVAQPAALV
jgi:vanillate O-demethylase monooxygenase subunit